MSETVEATPRVDVDGLSHVPRASRVLMWGLAASPAIAFIEASQLTLQNRLEQTNHTLFWEWTHLLPPWVTFAVCAALVVPFVRRFPLPQPKPANAIAAHVLAALAFPVLRLGSLDVAHVVFANARFVEHLMWLLADHYVTDVVLFWGWSGAGALDETGYAVPSHDVTFDS